jgi:GntR family transcriptional regulator, transcriptional repressor for pyruvate dehydrogenase complex
MESSALAAVFAPVQTPTTFEETVERLSRAIKLGLLTPSSRLPPERELAAQLGISRSTLRHALMTLVESGHLIAQRGRGGGTFVVERPPLVDDPPLAELVNWRSVLDLRLAIEAGSVLLAAERAPSSALESLSVLVERMDEASHFPEYRRADVRFHIGIAEAARSPRLVTAMTEVQGHMTDLIALIAHPSEVLSRSNAQHRRLLSAMTAGDGERAVRCVREHLQGTEHILAGLLPLAEGLPPA